MSSRNRIPPTIEPFLRLPPETALLLFTSTLGCSVNWATTRFIGNLITQTRDEEGVESQDEAVATAAVLLVSWVRDGAYWKTEVRRTMGVDVDKAALQGRFALVDFLRRPPSSLNGGGGGSAAGEEALLAEMERSIVSSLEKLRNVNNAQKVVLVLDNPDVLLALNAVSAPSLARFVLKLRSQVYSSAVICSADAPLLAAADAAPEVPPTPIETETAAFLVQQAHNARFVMSVRELDTGAAKDVSGVLRLTKGGSAYSDEDEQQRKDGLTELEALYVVQRDGVVKVFGRGSSEGA
ncbi:Hypothetical protein R9X50_00456100 [Acrodontium crateriforme]|uniref:Elongator complex protein 6 n=1 Tax=Acrodontium crateriforme TaxID=150365 RepID=A0AAQ3R8H2_9PEZI|nr:Hypothetical protein R9X50_00456100 [Acrodontium crateriforme]